MSELLNALDDVNDYMKDGRTKGAVYEVRRPSLAVKAIRETLKMSQHQFAEAFRFSVKTVQNWEQGLREPEGPARAYLVVIKRDPTAVQEALAREWAEYEVTETQSASLSSQDRTALGGA